MSLGFVGLGVWIQPSAVVASTGGVDFNDVSDLTTYFASDGTPVFTNQASGGINNSGSVNVPIPSNDLWTTKQAYSVTGLPGSTYTFSAYFKVAQNSGYGNLGFTDSSSGTGSGIGQPTTGIGVNFHGGGGAFVSNGVSTSLSWPPDLVLGNWYWMTFTVTAQGSNTFDLLFQIWNTDQTGVLGSMKTEKTLEGLVNATMGNATIIYGFFSAAGSRMSTIDEFNVALTGATYVEAGAPVVLSDNSATSVTAHGASFGGNVIDDNGSAVTSRGLCWSLSPQPTLADSCLAIGSGQGSFSAILTGLNHSSQYYVRAYATNSQGTSYGGQVLFMTLAGADPTPTPTPTPTTHSGQEQELASPAQIPNTGGSQAWLRLFGVVLLGSGIAARCIRR